VIERRHQLWLFFIGLIGLCCAGVPAQTARGGRSGYSGDAACAGCHRKEASTYLHTAHHLTSQTPDAHSILGSFGSGPNRLKIAGPGVDDSDARLYFLMEARADGFYETAVAESGTRKLIRSERIDIVVGSGVRGQTYLYWHGNQLYELPASYWSDGHRWINSPGYEDGTANFGRRADPRCLECHASYIRAMSTDPQTNLYDKDSLALGISCETCHGPGAQHVALETAARGNPAPEAAILNPSTFSRERRMDLCALCHNGTQRVELQPAFSYMPGKPVDDFFGPAPDAAPKQLDVHGNQVGLIKLSRCYISSPSMTCSTCHDVHARERTAASYSDRCLLCHRWQACGEARKMGSHIAANCIDCHMPMQETEAIVSVTAGKVLRTSIRNHRIAIYLRH
jgi:hypothetical protein